MRKNLILIIITLIFESQVYSTPYSNEWEYDQTTIACVLGACTVASTYLFIQHCFRPSSRATEVPSSRATEVITKYCSICLEWCNPHKMHAVKVCGHSFCSPCMESYIRNLYVNRAVIFAVCPGDSCNSPLLDGDCYILTKQEKDKLFLRGMKDDIFTAAKPRKSFRTAIRLFFTTKKCPQCGVRIQKSGGCDRMHCKGCGTHFSWRKRRIMNR